MPRALLAGHQLSDGNELDLYGYLENKGVGMLNFNEIKWLVYHVTVHIS
jgi:hypothetical protein